MHGGIFSIKKSHSVISATPSDLKDEEFLLNKNGIAASEHRSFIFAFQPYSTMKLFVAIGGIVHAVAQHESINNGRMIVCFPVFGDLDYQNRGCEDSIMEIT
jgi:hypothetical protein